MRHTRTSPPPPAVWRALLEGGVVVTVTAGTPHDAAAEAERRHPGIDCLMVDRVRRPRGNRR